MRQGKRKEREGEKAKSESRKCCATFKPKNHVGILLSAHAELCKRLFGTWLKRPAECTTCQLVIECVWRCSGFRRHYMYLKHYWVGNASDEKHSQSLRAGANNMHL